MFVQIGGHGSQYDLQVGDNLLRSDNRGDEKNFVDTNDDFSYLRVLPTDARIFVRGCNTGSHSDWKPNLADKIIRDSGGRVVYAPDGLHSICDTKILSFKPLRILTGSKFTYTNDEWVINYQQTDLK